MVRRAFAPRSGSGDRGPPGRLGRHVACSTEWQEVLDWPERLGWGGRLARPRPPRCVAAAAQFVRPERVQAFAGGCSRRADERGGNLRRRVVERPECADAPSAGPRPDGTAVQLAAAATGLADP